MSGWKTWVAAITSILWGVGGYLGGQHGPDAAVSFVTAGFGLIGIGHKLDRVAQ